MVIPDGWEYKKIVDIADVNVRSFSGNNFPEELPVTFIPMAVVDAERGVITKPEIRPLSKVRRGFTQFSEGDILFAKITPCMENGKAAIVQRLENGIGFGSTEFHVIRPRPGIIPKYIYHFIRQESFRNDAKSHFAGTAGQLRVPKAFIENYIIPVPPLPDQECIVARIESLFTQLDAGVAGLKRVGAALKRYRASVLKAAVEGRLVDAGFSKREIGEGELPQGWQWATIGHISELVTDGDHYPPKRVQKGIPHLTARNVKNWRFDQKDCTFITQEDYEKVRKRYDPKDGDVIITCVGTIGRTAIVPANYTFSADRNLAVIRPLTNVILSHYLQIFLNSPIAQEKMGSASGSTAQPHFYLKDLRSFLISLPPLAEQKWIVVEVERRLSVLQELEQTVAASLVRAARLRQAVLKSAFEGRLA